MLEQSEASRNFPGRLRLCRRIQHIIDEDAVAGGGVIHQHMGDSPNEFAVLDDGTAAYE